MSSKRGTTGTSSRRAFFTRGGAALGAGLATSVAGSALAADRPPESAAPDAVQQLSRLADREALRQLQLAFTGHIEGGRYEAATELFVADATLCLSGVSASGREAIRALLAQGYPQQDVPVLHRAYRQSAAQQHRDFLTIEDGRAQVTSHVDAEVCVPLQADCTAARMARLQGGFFERRWEEGQLEASCVKTEDGWKLASLVYRAV
jgi:hypothetical protein